MSDGNRDVLLIKLESGVVIGVTALIEVGDIDEVPVGLPTATLVLDHVSEGSSLDEGMVALAVGDVLTSHDGEEGFGLLESFGMLGGKFVMSHTGN